MYLFGRGKGNGLPDFLVPGGGGNIPELMQVVAQRGLVIVYTHSHIGWAWVGSGGVATLNSAAESVFAALEAMQDSGTLWVDTASNILDWMLANENVSIDAQTGSTVIVTNRNGSQMRGVTLESPDLGISAARIGDRYQIYSTANRVVLPELGPMESATVELLMGPIDPLFPRLNYVAPHTDVLRAEYDPDSRGLLLWIRGSGNEDPRARALSLTYRESGFFTLFDNGAPFAVIFNGNVSPVDPQYETSYEYSNGALSFVLPDPQDFHEIMLEFQDYPCPHDGDINHDGVTDLKDLPGFVAVLLGEESLPCTAIAADLDGSGTADGDDIAPFIQRLLAP